MGSSVQNIHSSTIMPVLSLLLISSLISLKLVEAQCDPEVYVFKSHQWNKGYVGKLYLGQTWLSGPSISWSLNLTFTSLLEEFKVWDADIQSPSLAQSISSASVRNVRSVVLANKCYNSILYPCQYLHLSFLVRFGSGSELTTEDYDISSVLETVDFSDGSSQAMEYCSPIQGQPTSNQI